MDILLEFLIVFIILYIINYLVFNTKTNNKKKKKKELRPEILYLTKLYKVDLKKEDYHKLSRQCVFLNTTIMSVIYIIVCHLIKGFVFQMVIGLVLLILLIIIGYGILGRYYMKRGKENV